MNRKSAIKPSFYFWIVGQLRLSNSPEIIKKFKTNLNAF